MSERYSARSEKGTEALENAAAERSAELNRNDNKQEKLNESEQSPNLEKARSEANAEALFGKEHSTEHKKHNSDAAPSSQKIITPEERKSSYKATMNELQKDMNPTEKAFSKIIHNKTIERVSDVVGNSVARPNSILYGSIFAFLGVMAIYMYARFIGFALSGFETIAAFIIGWIIGLLVDFFRIMIRGKR